MAVEDYLPLMGMAAGLLGGQQPGQRPNFASSLGSGLLGGLQGYQMAQGLGDDRKQRRLQELRLGLETARAQKTALKEAAQQMALAKLGEGKSPEQMAFLQAAPDLALQGYAKQMFPEQMTPYQQESIALQRQQLESADDLTPYQAAQIALEKQRLAIAAAESGRGPAPDYMTVRDPNNPSESIYIDKRTGQPLMQNGELVRPASTRDAGAPFSQSKDLRKAFEDLTKDPREIVTSYAKIESGFKEDTGPGDIAGIFGYMKMLDPTSVVREGEFATAENSAGIGESIRNLYNKAVSGERLTPKARQELLSAARSQLGPYKKRYDETASTYTGLANSFNVDPATVVTPLEFPSFDAPPAPMAPPAPAPYTPMVPGPGPMGDAPAAPVAGGGLMAGSAAAAQQPKDDWDAMFGLGGP